MNRPINSQADWLMTYRRPSNLERMVRSARRLSGEITILVTLLVTLLICWLAVTVRMSGGL